MRLERDAESSGACDRLDARSDEAMTTGQCALDLLAASLPHIDSENEDDDSPQLALTTNEREALYNLANKRQSVHLLGKDFISHLIFVPFPLRDSNKSRNYSARVAHHDEWRKCFKTIAASPYTAFWRAGE